MKFKKATTALVLALALFGAFSLVSYAANGLQEIKAYLNSGITIKLDGEEKVLTDANGVRTYPISYNNTTYLPVRSIAGLLGIDVGWDQATQSVLLGKQGVTDLIDTYKAYAFKGEGSTQIQSSEGKTENIGGVDVNHWIYLGYYGRNGKEAHFNLGGKYSSLTFQVYSKDGVTLTVYGDDQSVLAEIPVTGGAAPKSVTVPLFNTTELFFYYPGYPEVKNASLYIFDAKLS